MDMTDEDYLDIKKTLTRVAESLEKRRFNLGYIEQFFHFDAAVPILASKFFPNIKEITESMACFRAASHMFDPKDEDVQAICVGDGTLPKTGLLLAYLTRWDVVSVDPLMAQSWDKLTAGVVAIIDVQRWPIQRLSYIASKIQDADISFTKKKIIYVCVHSHAKFSDMPLPGGKEIAIVSMSCCIEDNTQFLGENSDYRIFKEKEYEDRRVLSPKRTIRRYRVRRRSSSYVI